MQTISSTDLQYTYSWNAIPPDNPRVTGQPDSTLLNRREGYEVLPFINRFASTHNINGRPFTKAEALKVERMIRSAPGSARSHANVKQWILDNWLKH